MNVIRYENGDFNFEKLWLAHILDALEAVGNKKIKVMNTLLELKNSENLIISTQRRLAVEAGVSLNTVNETLNILIDSDFLRRKQSGVYQINPDILFKGGNKKRLSILLEYNRLGDEKKVSDDPPTYLLEHKDVGGGAELIPSPQGCEME